MSSPRRALIVIDVQQEYFDGPLEIQYPPRDDSLANVVRAVELATTQAIPVMVVQHLLPAGAPVFASGSPGSELHPAIAELVQPEWKRVEKVYGSVFAGTDAAEWLRDNNIDTISIVGYMTNNCDIATAAHAESLGFTTEVLSDATGAIALSNEAGRVSAQQLHETIMVLLNSNFAAVATTEQWAAAVDKGESLAASNLVASALEGRGATV
jgi:nicotinamidase-related amidase